MPLFRYQSTGCLLKILIISPIPTPPGTAGNSARILGFAQELQRLGHEVWFFHVDFQQGDPNRMRQHWGERYLPYQYRKPWRKYRLCGIPIPDRWHHPLLSHGWLSQEIDQFYDDHMQEALQKLHSAHEFDAVAVNYVFFSKALEVFPENVLKVIDTHDVYTDRHKKLLQHGLKPEWFFTSRSEEKRGLARADRVIAIQPREAEFFSQLLGKEVAVDTVGHFFDPPGDEQIAPMQTPLRFGMLGSNNLLNAQALQWFTDNVMPALPEEFRLTLWGSVGDAVPDHPRIRKMGIIEDITSAYREADVFLNPMQWGTGLKIKTLEALSYGRLVVSTPCGLEGMEDAIHEGCWKAKDADDWVQQIRDLMHTTNDYTSASQSNINYTRQYLEENRANLKRIFDSR